MPTPTLRYSPEEHARRGNELYETQIRPIVEVGNQDRIVAIDIETGEFELADSTIVMQVFDYSIVAPMLRFGASGLAMKGFIEFILLQGA
jgi:hypothetical protein